MLFFDYSYFRLFRDFRGQISLISDNVYYLLVISELFFSVFQLRRLLFSFVGLMWKSKEK